MKKKKRKIKKTDGNTPTRVLFAVHRNNTTTVVKYNAYTQEEREIVRKAVLEYCNKHLI